MTKKLNNFNLEDTNHTEWLRNYLRKRPEHFLILEPYLNIGSIFRGGCTLSNSELFNQLISELDTNAEGRELWRQIYGAWNKKNKRDNNNNVKSYSFELNVDIKHKLEYLSKDSTIKKTLENLITNAYDKKQIQIKKNVKNFIF